MHLFIPGSVPDLIPSFCSVRLLLDAVEIIETDIYEGERNVEEKQVQTLHRIVVLLQNRGGTLRLLKINV